MKIKCVKKIYAIISRISMSIYNSEFGEMRYKLEGYL